MNSIKSLIASTALAVLAFLILSAAASAAPKPSRAAEGLTVFSGPSTPGIPADFMGFHNLEKEKNYGENWYFFVQDEGGALFFASLTITNLGLHTFDSILNATFVPPGGAPIKVHKEFGRKELKVTSGAFDVQIGRNRAWGAPPEFHITLDEKEMKADITLSAELAPYRRGDGLVRLGSGGASRFFGYGINAPRAQARGSVSAGGKTFTISGVGYHDHSWQTCKMTDIARKAVSLRLWNGGVTIDLQDQYLKESYGGGRISVGLVGRAGKIVAESTDYSLNLLEMKKFKGSPYEYPGRIDLNLVSGNVRVNGTLKVTEVFQSLDMLQDLSWPVRMAVRAFYGRPWTYRMRARYNLEVTIDGKTEMIQGEAIPSMLYY